MGMDASGGSFLGQVKVGSCALFLIVLAGCAETVHEEPRQDATTIELAANFFEAEFGGEVGRPVNDAVSVKSVSPNGSLVIVGFTATNRDEVALLRRQPDLSQQLLTAMIVDKRCDASQGRGVLNSGLVLETRQFDAAGRELIKTKLDKC